MSTDSSFSHNFHSCSHCALHFLCENSRYKLIVHTSTLKRKESLYSYMDPFTSTYAVRSGAIKTYHVDIEGNERINQFYLAGELLGFEAISLNHYPFSAMAIVDTTLCHLSYKRLLEYISAFPQGYSTILEKVTKRFNYGQYLTLHTSEQRVASFLLEFSQRVQMKEDNPEFDMIIPRQDIGHYLGLAPETISRLFLRLQQARLIKVSNKKIKLLNVARLKSIIQNSSCIIQP